MWEWKPISERLLSTRHNSTFIKLSILTCLWGRGRGWRRFLQELTGSKGKHSYPWCNKSTKSFQCWSRQQERRKRSSHGKGRYRVYNDNDSRLGSCCAENDLVVAEAIFTTKRFTEWKSTRGRTDRQTDPIISNGRWRSTLQGLRLKIGAHIGSDHNLLIGKLSLKLRKAKVEE